EGFRPFAPSVLVEHASEYFDVESESPYMLLTVPVKEKHRAILPDDYKQRPMYEKLYSKRSSLQAITHVDFSARIQTVSKADNPLYWKLIEAFRTLTGCGLVVNTSFNVRGEPMVCTPEDAYRCFMATEMDVCVIGSYLFLKEEQPDAGNREKWNRTFAPD
ncbi:carbamoyltransferase C-terminal domain-containing protein, partial [Balneolaceae bacterium ANBcel3]|nr:carbamoyltransferase C-terminal domain-containing protein [Balneolaceae bacterium ANBcel3]